MNTLEKLRLLRDKMKEEGLDGYLIPSSDPHMTEYLPDHYRARSWFSGFDGSSGTLAVTMFRAALWTDGRYFVQAKRQLKGSNIELMRTGEKDVLNVEAWLAEELPHKGIMGICSEITSSAFVESMDQLCSRLHFVWYCRNQLCCLLRLNGLENLLEITYWNRALKYCRTTVY